MELEIRVMWCRGLLTAFNFFQKLTVYAAASVISEDPKLKLTQQQKQEQKTPVDQEGNGNPEWNYPMKFLLSSLPNSSSSFQEFCLLFELRHHGMFLGDKNIGEVRVPLKDLIESIGVGVVKFVSYEVRNPEGKHNGVLDFSYKVLGNLDGFTTNVSPYSEIRITGYLDHHLHQDHQNQHQFDPERIEYPRIDLEGGDENEQAQIYPPPSSSSQPTTTHYPPPSYPPPGQPPWDPSLNHYPPPPVPPLPRKFLYPPPPYGDPSYCGCHNRPHEYQQVGGYDYPRW